MYKYFILMLIILLCIQVSSSNEKKDFLKAEVLFNSGKIVDAREQYTKFIKLYPMSKWRQVAETQLTKCNKLVDLQRKAEEAASNNSYQDAIDLYTEIVTINSQAVDTSGILPQLRKSMLQESANDVKRNSQFRHDLRQYRYSLESDVLITDFTMGLSKISGHTSETSTVKERFKKTESLYESIKTPPDQYKTIATDLRNLHAAYTSMVECVKNLSYYSWTETLQSDYDRFKNQYLNSLESIKYFISSNK